MEKHNARDSSVTQNRYISNPVPEGLTDAQTVAFIWTEGTRHPDHIKNWRRKLEREFPELFDALQDLARSELSNLDPADDWREHG